MEYTSYLEALDFVNQESNKIKVVVFSIKDCTTCDDFLPALFAPAIAERSDHFECVYVDANDLNIVFPPVSAPTAYFFIPNTEEPMPIFRVGGTTPTVLSKDLDIMIKIKDEGISLADAFSEPPTEVTSWVHRSLRF